MTRDLPADSAGTIPVIATLRRGLLACIALCAALAAFAAQAQRAEAPETSVKAAFIFKFGGYVEWPPTAFASPDAPLVIGIVGSDEIAAELERVVPGRQVAGHPVIARRMKEGESLRGLHMLFVGRGEAAHMQQWLRAAQAQGVLAVTEAARGLEMGSAINFVTLDDRVGFEVSLDSAEKSGYKISSRMLAVAKRVIPRS
ncbi:MAG: YfiR family protein [Usitatibacter sp.]